MPAAPGMLGSSSFSHMRQSQEQRWQRLGLRGNPFGSLPEDNEPGVLEHLSPFVGQIGALAAAAPFAALLIQAPCGWGKSTLLRLWHRELQRREQSVCLQVLHPGDRLQRLPGTGWLLLDEAQRLSPSHRRRLKRWLRKTDRRLVATTHEDLRPWLPGRTLLWTLSGPGPKQLQQWFAFRIALFGGDPARLFLTPTAAGWLLGRWAGNLHQIQDRLYHVFETAPADRLAPLDVEVLSLRLAGSPGKMLCLPGKGEYN